MALDFFAGSIGGIAGVLVGHPFDTVKVRLQTQPASTYSGMLDCFSKIIKQESVFGLYKGLLPPLAGFAVMNAVTFGVQGNVYRRLQPCTKHLFLSGAIAGVIQSSIVCPIELVKTRMQLQGQGEAHKPLHHERDKILKYSSSIDCIKKIYRSGGFKACYCGMITTVAREGPSVGVYIALYHVLCRYFAKTQENVHQLGVSYLLLAGGVAGSASWIVTYPIDVIKSRLQADINDSYKGIFDCFRKTYHSEGIGGFARGLSATIVRAFPVNAATLATVTLTLRWFCEELPTGDTISI